MWNIAKVVNTLELTDECIDELWENNSSIGLDWEEKEEFYYTNKKGEKYFYFNSDHMEHMDYMWHKEIIEIIKKHKLKGDVCFESVEGDNAGSKWGYRYDGKGGFVKLIAEVSWVESKGE